MEGSGFWMIQGYCICCVLYFYYYIVIHNEIIMQLILMKSQWEPWACFPGTRLFHLGVIAEWWGAAVNTDEASLTGLLLTSCCVAWFLIDQGLVLVLVPVLWTPLLNPILGTFFKPAYLFPLFEQINGIKIGRETVNLVSKENNQVQHMNTFSK